MSAPIKIGESLREGWELTKPNLVFLLAYQIIMYALIAIFSFGDSYIWQFIGWIVNVFVSIGFYKSCLLIADGIKPKLDQLYQNWRIFIPWVVAGILFGIMFTIGLFLLIIPAFYVWARYGLYPLFIADKGEGPIEALKMAARASEGNRWRLFLLFLTCVCVDILGLLLFGVGLLFTAPLTLLAVITVYRRLTSTTQVESVS